MSSPVRLIAAPEEMLVAALNPGKTSSHGCVRLTNWDAIELANMVAPGTVAVLVD